MRTSFLQWLDQRTGLLSAWESYRSSPPPDRTGLFRFLPTLIVFAFLLQVLTGLALWIHYCPAASSAWESIFFIQYILPGGWMVRGIHFFSAQLLTLLLGCRLVHLVFRGRYRPPGEFVFWAATLLLLLALGSLFTGNLLDWTRSGYASTRASLQLLETLPGIGAGLARLLAGGPELGTLTLPRFLVLHILVFGGGFGLLLGFQRYAENRARSAKSCSGEEMSLPDQENTDKPGPQRSFGSLEGLKSSLACLLLMGVILLLVYQKPIFSRFSQDAVARLVPFPEAELGVPPGAPAEPGCGTDSARPLWPFRALSHLSTLKKPGSEEKTDLFPGRRRFWVLLGVPLLLLAYFLVIPISGRIRAVHYIHVVIVFVLIVSFCLLTVDSLYQDFFGPESVERRQAGNSANRDARRTVELCLSPTGIPPDGVRSLLARDPLLCGPKLFQRHCASCHLFQPREGESEHPDFPAIPCRTPRAPNLYDPIQKKWIAGFFDPKRIQNDDYFGKTSVSTMVDFVRGPLQEIEAGDAGRDDRLDELAELLYNEAKQDCPREDGAAGIDETDERRVGLMTTFACARCHVFYPPSPVPVRHVPAPDLRGYMSRRWMIEMIADPASERFYGPDSFRATGDGMMPPFHTTPDQAVLSMEQIEILVDWLRGTWYRYEDTERR